MANNTPLPQSDLTSIPDALRSFFNCLREILKGRLNNVGTVTLTASAASTTLSDNRIGPDTIIILVPTTANAAAAVATTYQTYPNAANGAAVLNHANNSQSDRTFAYSLMGG